MSAFNHNTNTIPPQRQEYYGGAGATGTDPTVPRTTHGGIPVGAEARNNAMGSDYTTGGLHHQHGNVGAARGGNGTVEYGRTAGSGPAPTTAGPHTHDIMNKLDPRVDSTADHQPVAVEPHAHNSKIANVLDPRVDSTVANNTNTGATGNMHHSTAGAGYGGAGYGAHNATVGATGGGRTAGGTGPTTHQASPMSGPASRTAGPHSSNLLNKLDPSVDSRTGATNSTRGTGQTSTMHGANQPGMTRY
jgi:hypothetical protein